LTKADNLQQDDNNELEPKTPEENKAFLEAVEAKQDPK
jgi:hypothetical protein